MAVVSKKGRRLMLMITLAGTYSFPATAQLQLSGEIRPRVEYRHGFKTLFNEEKEAAFFISQRTRIAAGLQTDKVQYYLSLQNVHVWGDQPQLVVNNGNALGVQQAWAKLRFDESWALKVGRQEISYDDQRIFGSVDWAQQARSHDAVLLIFQDSTFSGELGLAYNQNQERLFTTQYTIPNNYKTFQYLWLHKKWLHFNGSFLFLNNGLPVNLPDGSYRTNFSQTIGSRLTYQRNKATAHLAFYYQTGKDNDDPESEISAYYLGADFGYSIKKYILSIGFEFLSGNDQLNTNTVNKAFNPFYGTNHKFNGHLDYFYVGNHLRSVGLSDIFLQVQHNSGAFTNRLALHYFQAPGRIALPVGGEAANAYLGTELDYSINWTINAQTSFTLGYSQLFGAPSMELLKGGDHRASNNWAWAMISFKPSYTFKKE